MSKASNSLSPQELLQCVAAIFIYTHCTVFLEMPVATFPVHTKPKVCTIVTDQISNMIKANCIFLILRPNILLANLPTFYFC